MQNLTTKHLLHRFFTENYPVASANVVEIRAGERALEICQRITSKDMTKKLFLMRHAQAESRSGASDYERKLSPWGRSQAKEAGLILREESIEMVMCSDSARTRETLSRLALPGEPHVEYMRALYLCSVGTLRQRISEVPDDINSLLVIAHAPAIPRLAAELSWSKDSRASDTLTCNYPTATFTQFNVAGSWSQFVEPSAEITELVGTQQPSAKPL